jgi:hypothetical protein
MGGCRLEDHGSCKPRQNQKPYLKKIHARVLALVVECLLSKCEALTSKPKEKKSSIQVYLLNCDSPYSLHVQHTDTQPFSQINFQNTGSYTFHKTVY